jgi:hypothetical protein
LFENNEINAIINEIKKKLNIYEINLKDITNILFLLEWNFINKTEYRLFNINWKNEASENINIIRNFLLEHEIELKQETRFETIKTKNIEHKLTTYIKKSIEEVISLEDLLNKSEFYFLETLPLDLSILKIKKIIDIDIEDLLKRKKNKEY